MTDLSHSVTKQTTLLWIVKDVCELLSDGPVKSSLFSADRSTNKIWRIVLSYRDDGIWLEPGILLDANSTTSDIEAYIMLSIIDAEFQQVNQKHAHFTFISGRKQCLFNEFISKDEVLDESGRLLFNGDFILCCHIAIRNVIQQGRDHNNNEKVNCCLRNSLSLLQENAYFSDFVVRVKNKQFLCHKFVLACRSEYFSAMFRNNVRESTENKLDLTDVEPNIFEKLLSYIYNGEIDILEDDAVHLLKAADKFRLERLKVLCEEKLHSFLSLGNALDIFIFASFYDLQKLKMNAYHVLTDFVKKVSKTNLLSAQRSSVQSVSNDSSTNTYQGSIFAVQKNRLGSKKAKMEFWGNTDIPIFETADMPGQDQGTKLLPFKVDIWCSTEIQILEEKEWRVKDFKKYDFSSLNTLSSHTFNVDESKLLVEIRTDTTNSSGDLQKEICIYLDLISSEENAPLSAECRFSTSGNQEEIVAKCKCDFTANKCSISRFGAISHILSNSRLFDGDDLVLCCCIAICRSNLYECTYPTIPRCNLESNMRSSLEEKVFTDINVKIGSDTFPCHKAILCCHSPFFAAELRPQDNSIDINDIEPGVFKKILSAMYTGICQLTVPEMVELFRLEKKYWFFETTDTFNDAFVSALSVENAARIAAFAASEKAKKLKRITVKFIIQNLEKVVRTPDWGLIVKCEELLAECLYPYIV